MKLIQKSRNLIRAELEAAPGLKRFGSGWISGIAGLVLGVSSLGLVLTLRLPGVFSMAELTPMQSQPWFRMVLFTLMVIAFGSSVLSLILRESKTLGTAGMIATLLASALGGSMATPVLTDYTPAYVGHEINNPINGIMNYARLIADGLDPKNPLHEFAEEIGHESTRVASIVHNLLGFARQDHDSGDSAAMSTVINDTLSLIRTIIGQDQIQLKLDIPIDLPELQCRSQQIRQVLMNLLTNARDALNSRYPGYDQDKIIAVTVRPLERAGRQWLRTTVEDHGIGISPEIRDRLFDPFFTTKSRTKGTGLGLSVSHGIVQEHHGELSIESQTGRYTRFHLDLPLSEKGIPGDPPRQE